ncbi:MAG: polyisoprenoid-binding protein [Acidimicrobiaceae bacterium]|nr:polyisoprenoid-binding protein [Acidimicrobiaceae bacterium]
MTTVTDLPLAAGAWQLDQAHSGVHFKVRHLGLTNVRGRFNGFDAWLEVGEDLATTRFGAIIEIATVDTNQPDRDAHLRSTDFFSAETRPTMTFESTTIEDLGDGEYEATGELTINGITEPVTLRVEFTGVELHPGDGLRHAGFIATTQILRDDFGIDFNMPLGVDKYALGKKIDIEIDAQFTAPAASA